jgi:hypothetical protein
VSEHKHLWVVVKMPERFPGSPYLELTCACKGWRQVTTPDDFALKALLAWRDSDDEVTRANLKIIADVLVAVKVQEESPRPPPTTEEVEFWRGAFSNKRSF